MTNASGGSVRPVRRALLSVSDKTGLIDFARRLAACGAELVSTGGTASALRAAGLDVRDVADVTGFPEMLDGRVKTLHPAVHAGLLRRPDDARHTADMARAGFGGIDLLAVNLYPFEATLRAGGDFEACVEQIDIGGPAMIRAAAKNHEAVAVLTDPSDYDAAARAVETEGGLTRTARRRLAAKAFRRTAAYDAAIAGWITRECDDDAWPERFALAGSLASSLRYGENPHQRAALYRTAPAPGPAHADLLQGKPLSYNNLNDTEAAHALAEDLSAFGPAIVIVKHANPCGAAAAETLIEAHALAIRCDPVSAFGGVVAANRPVDAQTAERIVGVFTEVVIAPAFDAAALEVFARKPNLRVLATGATAEAPAGPAFALKSVSGGFLVQTRDDGRIGAQDLKVVTRRAPSDAERADLLFAFRVAKHVASNAIVYAKGGAVVGVGAGQMSRVDSARIAARKACEAAKAAGLPGSLANGSVVASDAFFPFPDGLLAAAEAGATAVIQPGGSKRDADVIAAADAAGLAMVFTGMRHFRH